MPLIVKALLLLVAHITVRATGLLATAAAAKSPVGNSRLFASVEQHVTPTSEQVSENVSEQVSQQVSQQVSEQVSEQALLRFTVDMINESEPLEGSEEEIIAAFRSATLRDSLITPNPADVEEFILTPAWKSLWGDRCFLTDSQSCSTISTPETAKGVRFRTGAVDFPGLKVESRVVCGVHQMPNAVDWIGGGPYEFVVLEAKNSPTGSRPMVWLFEKLTGKSPPLSRSITLAGLQRTAGNKLVLRYVSKAVVEFAFPKVMMRLLPMSKERTEEIGSNALEKAVRKEVHACMKVCQEYFKACPS
jgi:hypothetical protein